MFCFITPSVHVIASLVKGSNVERVKQREKKSEARIGTSWDDMPFRFIYAINHTIFETLCSSWLFMIIVLLPINVIINVQNSALCVNTYHALSVV